MAIAPPSLDPRIRRTRLLLQDALVRLLENRGFDELSIQDIAEQATVNRATFYAHYADKYELLTCMTASRFMALLDRSGAKFDGGCPLAIKGVIRGVCAYLMTLTPADSEKHRQTQPHMESAMIAVVRQMLLDGLRRHPRPGRESPELRATTAGWAIYGAAKQWSFAPGTVTADEAVETIFKLVSPILFG